MRTRTTPSPRRGLVVAAMTIAAVVGLSVAPAAGHADHSRAAANRCYGAQASGTSSFDPVVGGFTGTATFRLGGQAQEVTTAAFITGPDSTSHEFSFLQGTVVTDDLLILDPIDPAAGLFQLRTRLQIVDGGTGRLHILPGSTLDLSTGEAAWEMRGHVCFD